MESEAILERLKEVTRYAYDHAPFYRRIWDDAGFHPDHLKSLEDFEDKVPVIAKKDLREAQKVLESGEIPIWAPSTGEFAGIALVSPARAVAKGLRLRDVQTTVADTLAWHAKRPAEQQQKLKAGLTPEREAELLKLWRAASKQE